MFQYERHDGRMTARSDSDERPRTDGGREVETPPVAMNHVGHTVPDIEAAVEWYRDVLGFSVVAAPTTVPAGSGHFADLVTDIVGEFESVTLAHLEAADGTGFELFEYEATPDEGNARDPPDDGNWQARPGIHHFAVTHPDVEGLAQRIEARGGEEHSAVWRLFPDQEYDLVYVRDPWGNFLEVYSRSYVQAFANQG
jgi:catechol 2,3-dioxygenase-like lactoylglutathione lyase family enzyme